LIESLQFLRNNRRSTLAQAEWLELPCLTREPQAKIWGSIHRNQVRSRVSVRGRARLTTIADSVSRAPLLVLHYAISAARLASVSLEGIGSWLID